VDLEDTVQRLLRRQEELERRVAELERERLGRRLPRAGPVPPPLPRSVAGPPEQPPAPPAAQPRPALETRLGLNWINRIAVLTLILGAGFLFKYGVDNQWIGPGARVALGIVAAFGSLLAGEYLSRRGQAVFAQGLTALGLALFYLSFYAAAPLYHLIPQEAAFALMSAATAAACAFALYYESQAIAVMGLAGGYITPPALSAGENHPWILFTYVFLLNLGALWIARRRRDWKILEPAALAATAALYAGWYEDWFNATQRTPATLFAVAFYAQFALAGMRAVWWFGQLLAPLAAAAVWDRNPGYLPLALLFAGAGLAVADFRGWPEAPAWSLLCYWLPLWQWKEGFPWISAAFLLFFAWAPWRGRVRQRAIRVADLLVIVAGPLAYFAVAYFWLNPQYHAYMGLFALALGALHLLLTKLLWVSEPLREPETWPALVSIGVAFAFVTLAVPVQFAGFRITIAWALEGLALAWFDSKFNNRWLDYGAWTVLALVIVRLLAIDLEMYSNPNQFPALVNVRFLTFLASCIALWLGGLFLRTPIAAGAAYIAGHCFMLLILGLEISGWVDRNLEAGVRNSVLTVSISIMMALYAVALVTLGVATRTMLNRILGLGLVAIVIAKLYLLDVWILSRVFRITAFLALGALLLAVSYLYSRYRPRLERLWRGNSVD